MSLRRRIERIEQDRGTDHSEKLFLHVLLDPDEDPDSGLDRYLREHGIDKSRVGHAVLIGQQGYFERDYGGYRNIKRLQGYSEYSELMDEVLRRVKPTLGPPSKRHTENNNN